MGKKSRTKRERREAKEALPPPPPSEPLPAWKKVVFSLIPLLLLLAGAEAIIRVTNLAHPSLTSVPFQEETAGLFQPDPDLFWSLPPGIQLEHEGAKISINSLGLRAPEIGPKKENEFRILSLGESTTFGVGVNNNETYTELMAGLLQKRFPDRLFTGINGGVSAYSSFQSLKYLETRGLKLEPDLVLFYHEVNDYLPSTLRNAGHTDVGALKTDKQLYESKIQGVYRELLDFSALMRFLNNRVAYRKIHAFNREQFENPLLNIGLPDISIAPRLAKPGEEDKRQRVINEAALGRRVSETERSENLQALTDLCREKGIELIILHPSYRQSSSHQCLLTRFCAKNKVLKLETYPVLHPPGLAYDALYRDGWHPNRAGHKRLAEALAEFIANKLF